VLGVERVVPLLPPAENQSTRDRNRVRMAIADHPPHTT
jgi:hypothetical protein